MSSGCGIYKIVNLVDGKFYIGSSVDMSDRMKQHKYKLKGKRHDNDYLQHAFDKYGESNFLFSVVEECAVKDLIERENYYIIKFGANDLKTGYNLALVNEFRRNTFNEVVKEKQSVLNLKKNGNFIKFKSVHVETGIETVFESLVSAANFLLKEGFVQGKAVNLRMRLSNCLRKKRISTGKYTAVRETVGKHKWLILE